MKRAVLMAAIALAGAIGFAAAKVDDHVERTMWGWVWRLKPEPDFYGTQLVKCPNGDLTLPPFHVYVLWHDEIWLGAFLQERGR